MTTRSLIPATWEVPERFRQRLGSKVGRQRLMEHDGHVMLVTHRPPRLDEDHRVGRFFWRSPDGDWHSNDMGAGPQAIYKHVGEYADRIEALDQREQQAQGAEAYFSLLEELAPVHRAMSNSYRVLQEARRACPDDRDLIDARDRAYEVQRSGELLYANIKNGLDYQVARRAEEQARSGQAMAVAAHRLNLLAAFFFPIATISAVFGMSIRSGLEDAEPPAAFLAFLIAGLLAGTVLTLFVTRRSESPSKKRG